MLGNRLDTFWFDEFFSTAYALKRGVKDKSCKELSDILRAKIFCPNFLCAAAGFKFVDWQVPYVLDILKPYPSLHVIHICRSNFLRRYLSWKMTEQSKVWCTADKEYTPTGRLFINTTHMLNHFVWVQNWYKSQKEIFRDRPSTDIIYESLVRDTQVQFDRICAFLGLHPEEPYSWTVKLESRRLSEIIINYDEVCLALKGTQWENFLDD